MMMPNNCDKNRNSLSGTIPFLDINNWKKIDLFSIPVMMIMKMMTMPIAWMSVDQSIEINTRCCRLSICFVFVSYYQRSFLFFFLLNRISVCTFVCMCVCVFNKDAK